MPSFNSPALGNTIAADVPELQSLLTILAKMDYTGATDIPLGAIRWNKSNQLFEAYDGSTWKGIGKLAHDVETVDGHSANTGIVANTLPVRDADGAVPGNITGNAATATTAAGVSQVVPVAKGGTGAANSAEARQNLGVAYGTAAGTVAQGNDARIANAVSKKGDIMTGPLQFNYGTRTNTPVDIRTGDANGDALLMTAGGLTVVGGGEFPQTYYASGEMAASAEHLVLGADVGVYFIAAYETAANAKRMVFDGNGNLRPITNNTLGLGTAGQRFGNGFFTNLNVSGTITGKATGAVQADKATSATSATRATSADKLTTARTIAVSGGATGTATAFDGSKNIAIPITALDVGKATAGVLPVARGGTGNSTGKATDSAKFGGKVPNDFVPKVSNQGQASTFKSAGTSKTNTGYKLANGNDIGTLFSGTVNKVAVNQSGNGNAVGYITAAISGTQLNLTYVMTQVQPVYNCSCSY